MGKLAVQFDPDTTCLRSITVQPRSKSGLVELQIKGYNVDVVVELTARQAEDLAAILPGAARDARG